MEFRRQMRSGIEEFSRESFSTTELESFLLRLHYIPGSFEATLLTRSDGIEAAWQINSGPSIARYTPGSWGPKAATELLARDGRKWRYSCAEHN